MLELASGWHIQVDHSAEWIFFRVEGLGSEEVQPPLSESLWTIAETAQINRLVCELADDVWMKSYLVGQLVILHKRAHLEGGTLRFCGLSPDDQSVLINMGLSERLPNYATREDAVMGYHPRKPR